MKKKSNNTIIPNSLLLIPSKAKGFTLIELLVVIVIMVVVGTIVGSILFSSLRDSNKTSNINEVRTNGTFALSQMTKVIQGAKQVVLGNCNPAPCTQPTPVLYSSPGNALTVTNLDNTNSTISANTNFIYYAPPNPIPSVVLNNSKIEIHDNTTTDIDGTIDPCANSSSNIFSYQQQDKSSPIITINFFMRFNTLSTFAEQKVCIPFQTSVSPRNFGQ